MKIETKDIKRIIIQDLRIEDVNKPVTSGKPTVQKLEETVDGIWLHIKLDTGFEVEIFLEK